MFKSLRHELAQAVAVVQHATVRFDEMERHLEHALGHQQTTIEWLRHHYTDTKMQLAASTALFAHEHARLLNVQRDFDWARLRINQLEAERATLLARVLAPTGPVHFAVPELQPAPSPPTIPADLKAQFRDIFGAAALFEDQRDDDDDDAKPSPTS